MRLFLIENRGKLSFFDKISCIPKMGIMFWLLLPLAQLLVLFMYMLLCYCTYGLACCLFPLYIFLAIWIVYDWMNSILWCRWAMLDNRKVSFYRLYKFLRIKCNYTPHIALCMAKRCVYNRKHSDNTNTFGKAIV